MIIDRYTKIVLTVIAVSLFLITASIFTPIADAGKKEDTKEHRIKTDEILFNLNKMSFYVKKNNMLLLEIKEKIVTVE